MINYVCIKFETEFISFKSKGYMMICGNLKIEIRMSLQPKKKYFYVLKREVVYT